MWLDVVALPLTFAFSNNEPVLLLTSLLDDCRSSFTHIQHKYELIQI